MRKWSEIVIEAVGRGQKTFENVFNKTFQIGSIMQNRSITGYKGRIYEINKHDYDDSGNNYYVDILRTVNDNGQTVYQLIGLSINGKNGKLIDEKWDGALYKKYNFNVNYGFPETVESAKIIEKLLDELVKTNDFNKFIKDWKRLGYIESQKENQNTAFEKPLSRFAGMEGKEIKEGTILVNTWGYEQTNVDFYKVLSRKGDTVILRKLENKRLSFDNKRLASLEVPSDKFEGDSFKKKVIDGWKSEEVKMQFSNAIPWNGKPVEATHYA